MEILKRWILHPFLFAAYPVVALLAFNIKQIGPMYALRPLVLALLLSILILGGFRLVLKDWQKAGLAASLTLLLFFTYGHVHDLLISLSPTGIYSKNRYLGILWIMLFAAGIWLIVKIIKTPQNWTRILNVVGAALLAYSLVQIGLYEIDYTRAVSGLNSAGSGSLASQLHPQTDQTLPDIYYIIPEDYTRSDGLAQVFGYDNSAFVAGLEQKGFYTVTCSRSNYVFSSMSIAAALNMQYLDTLSSRLLPPNPNEDDVDPYLQDNAVRRTLADLGYKFVSFQTGYGPTEFPNADVYLSPQTDLQNLQLLGGLTPFEAIFFQTTGLNLFYGSRLFPRQWANTLFSSAYLLDRNRILYTLDKLPQVVSMPGPKFVFVHFLGPHNPFVFGSHGEVLKRNAPFTLNDDLDAIDFANYTAGYTGEINYLNTRMLEDVSAILANSRTPPIIIIQSDTGSTRSPVWVNANLAAIYFPGDGKQNLYPSLTQVNTFRLVFNTYFGGHLALLNDATCNSGSHSPYQCTPLPDPNPQCLKP